MMIRLIIGLFVISLCQCEQNACRKIAVIGAGIAGGSAAYFTQQFLEEAGLERAEIEIFEANDYIGGRLKHIEFHGATLEVGGAAWAKNNHYMMEMAEKMGVNVTGSQTDSEHLRYSAVWTGRGFAPIYKMLVDSSPSSRTIIKEEASFMHHINSNYMIQHNSSFTNLHQFISWGGMDKYTTSSVLSYFEALGVASDFVETELVPMTRAIYNQGSSANVFSLLASLDAILSQYSVLEGNSVLVEKLLEHNADHVHLQTPVKTITKTDTGKYVVEGSEFDVVFIAAPLEVTNIEFVGFGEKKVPLDRDYYDWYITVLQAEGPNPSQFEPFYEEHRGPRGHLPTMIVTTTNSSENSKTPWVMIEPVGKHAKDTANVDNDELPLWIIYSDASVKGDIERYFTGVGDLSEQYWPYTFPHLTPLNGNSRDESDVQPVVLDGKGAVFNINSVESLASAMEISAIGARNAAKLAVDYLSN